MGSLFGSGSQTTTGSSQPVLSDEQSQMLKQSSRIVDNFYNNLKGGQDAALDAGDYSKLVAPLSADQQTAMGLTRSAATNGEYGRNTNAALGLIGQGSGIAKQGIGDFRAASSLIGQATKAPNVSQFYNPYQQDVINTTVNDLNTQTGRQQAALSAAQAGKRAFGSRADLATGQFQGDANRTLASTIAGLRSTGYNTALSAAQNQQRQQLQGAQQYGALGSQYGQLGSQVSNIGQTFGQQAGQRQSGLLNTAQALGQSGALQQQQQQAAIDAPLTTAGRISSIAAGYPTGTATTQSTPTASPFSQILGAGLTAASFFADGGMANGGPAVDLAAWKDVPTDQILFMLQKMDPADPNRDLVSEVYSQRVRDEGPSGRAAGRGDNAGSGAAGRYPGILGAGTPRSEKYAAGRVPGALGLAVPSAPAEAPPAPRSLGAPQPAPQLPTNMSQFSPAEEAAGAEFNAMKAAQPAAPTEPVAPFLGGAPQFSDIRGLGGPSPMGPSPAGGALSFSGTPRQPDAAGFPKMAAALSDLMTASAPAADAGAPRGLGNGRSMRPVTVAPNPASNPAPVAALNPATNAAAASLSPEGGDQSTATVGGGKGWLGRHLDNAMDNPLLYIGLGLMASKNPSILGAIGEGVGGGIGQYTERQIGKARLGLAMQKNQQDVAFERQKLAIQQAVAEGRMTFDQARLALAQSGNARAQAALGRASPTQERIAAIRASGGTDADVLRYARGATEPQDDEDKRQKYALDYIAKNPGADPQDAYTAYDATVAGGANTDDLKAAAGF